MQTREALLSLAQLCLGLLFWPIYFFTVLYQWAKTSLVPTSAKKLPHRGKKPKVSVITGAASGFGREFALHYAEPGSALCLIDLNEEGLEETKRLVESKVNRKSRRRSRSSSSQSNIDGVIVETAVLSVADQAGMEECITSFDDRYPVDLVMANAGISGESPALESDIVKATRLIFSINVDGVFNTVCPLIERMKARGKGQIALTSSMAGLGPVTRMPVYAASKMAVRGWGESLRHILGPDGIFVNIIAPAFVETPMTASAGVKLPFLVPLDVATKTIVDGLARNVSIIALPWQMFHLRYLMDGAAPLPVRDWFESRLERKKVE